MISPRKILAIKLRALGDTVLMTAPVNELRRLFPMAEIHLAVLTPWASVFKNFPGINQIWNYDRHPEAASRAKAVARLALKLRKERYDLVVNFHASPSSSTLAFATGAKTRAVHFHGHTDKNRFSTVEIPGKGQLFPVIERDMNALRALGIDVPQGRLPKIYLDPVEVDHAFDLLDAKGLKGPLLAVGIGSSRPTKAWPIERFAEVARKWCDETQGSVLAVGSEDEEELGKRFLAACQNHPRIQIEHRLGVRELAATLKASNVMLGNDSGPRHIAVAVGTPTVTLFGPEDPFEWHPYPQDLHPYFYIKDLACRRDAEAGMPPWCSLHTCTVEAHQCMQRITAAEVAQQVLEVALK